MKTIYGLLRKKPGFPSKWSERDLGKLLDEAHELVSKPVGGVELDRAEAIINVATNELAGRASRRNFRASIVISVAAILISIGVSLWTSYSADIRSKHWEENQLQLLREIKQALTPP